MRNRNFGIRMINRANVIEHSKPARTNNSRMSIPIGWRALVNGYYPTPNIGSGSPRPTMTYSGSRRIRGVASRSSPNRSWTMNFEMLISTLSATSFSRTTKSRATWRRLFARYSINCLPAGLGYSNTQFRDGRKTAIKSKKR